MSNTIVNHLYVYGPQERLDSFLAAFLRDGMQAHVPIPADAEPSEDPSKTLIWRWEQIELDRWGASWIGPDIYWTCGGAYGVSLLTKNAGFQAEERQLANVRKLDLHDHSESPWSTLPGCIPPSKEDAIAYFKFYSQWNPPFKWFGQVATNLYVSGLHFMMDSIDLSSVANDGSHEINHYWSVDGAGEFYKDGHWAACLETVDSSDDPALNDEEAVTQTSA
jgi:hypothetical protein